MRHTLASHALSRLSAAVALLAAAGAAQASTSVVTSAAVPA